MRKANCPETEEEFITDSEEKTILLARDLAKSFKGNEVVLLEGELGAGKTVFVKGIATGLELKNVHQVCSPSFTLVNIYHAKYPIFHIDLYRVSGYSELEDAGIIEHIHSPGIKLIEWFEKIRIRTFDYIKVEFEWVEKYKRRLRFYSKPHRQIKKEML